MGLTIPESAAELTESKEKDRIFINPYCGKEVLTRKEAIDLINLISGELLASECINS